MVIWVINFVDYSLNQGAPAGHQSAETPIGHESVKNKGLLDAKLSIWDEFDELSITS